MTAIAAALGFAGLGLLLVIHEPSNTSRRALLTGAALVTVVTVLAASVHIEWSWVGPVAVGAAYVLTTTPRFSLRHRRNRGTARDPR